MSEITDTNPPSPTVIVELVGGESYTTLTRTFRNDGPIEIPRELWEEGAHSLQKQIHPGSGLLLFREVGSLLLLTPPIIEALNESGEIKITHKTNDGTKNGNHASERGPGPNDMTTADLPSTGIELDTGADVTLEEGLNGPSGYEGLDDEEPEVEPAKTLPPLRRVVVTRKGSPKDSVEV